MKQALSAAFLQEPPEPPFEEVSSIWWSELIVSMYGPHFLQAFEAFQIRMAERLGLDLALLGDIVQGVGAEPVAVELSKLEHEVKAQNASVDTYSALAKRLDRAQRLWRESSKMLPSGRRLPLPLALLKRIVLSLQETRGQGLWWRGESGSILSINCFSRSICNEFCVPLLVQAAESALLSRHRFFLFAEESSCASLLRQIVGELGLSGKVESSEKFNLDSEIIGTDLSTLGAWKVAVEQLHYQQHLPGTARKLRSRKEPSFAAMLGMTGNTRDTESALSQVWDAERWMLHSGVPHGWDILMSYEDGPRRSSGVPILDCVFEGEGAMVVPRTSMLFARGNSVGVAAVLALNDIARSIAARLRKGHLAGASSEPPLLKAAAHTDEADMFPGIPSAAIAETMRPPAVKPGAGGGANSALNRALAPPRQGLLWRLQTVWRSRNNFRVTMAAASDWRSWARCSDHSSSRSSAKAWPSKWGSVAPDGALLREESAAAAESPNGVVGGISGAVCERHSAGVSGKVDFRQPSGSMISSGNCFVLPGVLDLGSVQIRVGVSTEVFFCPRLAPVAIHGQLRVGSHSVGNWAAEIDGLQDWLQRVKAGLRNSTLTERGTRYVPPALWSPCCRTGVGRLIVAVVRSPFDRLRSFYNRREGQVSHARFVQWVLWSLDRIRSGDLGASGVARQAQRSSDFSDVWTESDAAHLAPLARTIGKASINLADFVPEALTANDGPLSEGRRLLLVIRLEHIHGDTHIASELLRTRFGHEGPPLPDFPLVHKSKVGSKSLDEIDCCPWTPEVVEAVRGVYAEELRLGRYPAALGAAPPVTSREDADRLVKGQPAKDPGLFVAATND